MVAGSGQWAAAAGRQVGLWAHQGVTDARRELESVGRQGSSNNYPREVIEWDRDANAYTILGPASEIREEQADEERREGRIQQIEALVAALDRDSWGKADAYEVAKQLGWGQKRADELLKLALAEERVDLEVAAHGEHVYTVRA
jgi:hypothetical protein